MLNFNSSLIDHFKRLQAYDQWATGLLLQDLQKLPVPDPTALSRLSHVLFGEDVWLARLLGEDLSRFTTPWPERSPAECVEALAALGKKWAGYLGGLKDSDFEKIVSYKNTKGQAYQVPVGAILAHVFDHSTYHRGQVATAIKKAGGEPHNIGFYTYVLENQK